MPTKLDNKRMNKKEHKIWRKVKHSSGSGGAATQAVRKYRRKRGK